MSNKEAVTLKVTVDGFSRTDEVTQEQHAESIAKRVTDCLKDQFPGVNIYTQ